MAHQFKVKRKDGRGYWVLPHMDQSQIDALIGGKHTGLHHHDEFYYTKTQLDSGQLDNRYYTETEIDATVAVIDGRLDSLEQVQLDLHEPTGFIEVDSDAPGQTISFLDGTRTFTIAPTGASFSYYINGTKYTKTSSENLVISDTEGIHFIYYDGDVLKETVGFSYTFLRDLLRDNAYVAVLYWDATNSKQIYLGEEFHGTVQDWKTHLYLHLTRGVQLESGGALGDILAEQNGDDDEDAQFSVQATVLWDENLRHESTARGSTETISVYYRTGLDTSNNL